jgi:hypothetical protein
MSMTATLRLAIATLITLSAAAPSAQPDQIAAETGGHASQYVDAVMADVSTQSCTVLLSVVRAGTLAVVTDGFQMAIDAKVDIDHPASYTIGLGDDDRATFAGGGLHEVTADFKNGVLTFPDAPKFFAVEMSFGPGSGGSALIHRQCFSPRTRLIYVMDNPDTGVKGGDWLWDKGAQ